MFLDDFSLCKNVNKPTHEKQALFFNKNIITLKLQVSYLGSKTTSTETFQKEVTINKSLGILL